MQIVKNCGLSWSTVNVAIKRYKQDGLKALMPEARGRKKGTGRILSKEQETAVFQIISRKRPLNYKIKRYLWNREAVMQVIKQECGISLSERGLANYLGRWGCVLENRQIKSMKRNLNKNCLEIRQKAQDENTQIFWMNRTKIRYIVETSTEQSRMWMISFVNIQGKIHWLIVKNRFSVKRQISFLKALIKDSRKRIFLLTKKTNVKFSDETLRWIKQQDRLKYFLI